ncbi:MAG: PAS domain S-box protein [Pseudomonadota bacterium]
MPMDKRIASLTDEGRYRLLIESVTDYAIYMLDPNGIITSWNPGAQRFKGYLPDEIIGQHFSRFYTPEDQATGLPARALRTAATEGKFEAEGWRVRKDGSRFWAYVIIDPIRAQTGELIGYVKITRDLTERRAAEEVLRQSQEQFRLLVRGVTDYALYMLDRDGRVSNWNMGAQRIKGYLPEEVIGTHFSRFYTDEDRDAGEPQKALKTVQRDGRFENEGWRLRKDGSRFWAHVVIDAIRDDDGQLIGYAKITRDITERREAALKLEKTREALLQSQKMEAIGQLTGGIAHDFNNLLMAIMGSLELMRKRMPDDPRLMSLLKNAAQGVERGTLLTKRMLAFARRQELKQEAVDVPALVRGMSDLMHRSLGPSVNIETRFPLQIRPVLADANQLEMAILNLSVNARDAIGDRGDIIIGTREVTVSAANGDLSPGDYVCISVTDNGNGMDEETLRRAMEPFFTTKGVGKGTGLGLSMVHGLAEQSGGRFVLNSKVGEGTTAELWLPVAEPVSGKAKSTVKFVSPVATAGLTILAVDDDPLVLTNTIAMLEDLGHLVHSASSAKAALKILAEYADIEMVITDQAMPQMTGIQLAKIIAQDWPHISVLLATGYAEIEPGTSTGLPKLAKPFTQAELADEIARLLPKRKGGGGRVVRFPRAEAKDK